MKDNFKKTIIICGPTASGKTSIAEMISRKHSSPIINADQSQVLMYYRIGTGRYFNSDDIDHRLSGTIDPLENPTIHDIIRSMHEQIATIREKGVMPIVCGGSHHLIERFIKGMDPTPLPDEDQRRKWRDEGSKFGRGYLHNLLKDKRPDLSRKVHPNNINRILRYLEIAHFEKIEPPIEGADGRILTVFVKRDLDPLKKRISDRIEMMLEAGWVKEVEYLCSIGLRNHIERRGPIGYDHVLDLLDGIIDRENASKKIYLDTLDLAKKQLKWRKRLTDIHILNGDAEENLPDMIDDLIDQLE